MKRISLLFSLIVLITGCDQPKDETKYETKVEQWSVFEIELKGPSTGNPYRDVELEAVFLNGEENIRVPGFYDGEGIYRIRFSPKTLGNWTYRIKSNEAELSGQTGEFKAVAPTGENHGPVNIVNTFYLQYADGTPFYAVGTTAYQWTSVKQDVQAKTLETLAESPFNKIRMCVFPKSYRYGNESEP
jgi:hypothetical protein